MLTEAFLRSLRTLRLSSLRRRQGSTTGERRSVRRGRSVEFADYRNYTPGDDPRRVDWNIYARLERPYIKLFEEEEDLTTHILLDTSASMRWVDEETDAHGHASHKWEFAADLATALAYIVLASGDRLVLSCSHGARFGPRRGAAALGELIPFIQRATVDAEAGPRIRLDEWMRRYAVDAKPGLCLVISDLLDEEGCTASLNALGAGRLDVNLLHTLDPDELDPKFIGDLRLTDVETSAHQDMSMDPAVLNQYQARLGAWTQELRTLCQRRGGRYLQLDTGTPLERVLLQDLRKAGWLV